MPDRAARKIALLIGLAAVVPPSSAGAQTASPFQGATLEVVSEWTGQDRGDGSGSYRLTTRVTDSRAGMTIQHQLAADRDVRLEVESSESLSVYQGESETAHAESDPTALGVWAEPAIAYAIPFDVEFSTDARKSYRPRERQVEEIVHSAAPDARVSTRAASDGRTMAVVEIPGVLPVTDLARMFVGIREAFADADVGLAKLQIKGQADASASVEASAAQ
jgi:hypothetical protein